jgi:beta-mannosidase
MQKILLHEGWRMRPADSDEWINAHVPGSVLADLLASKRIDDPFWRTNEYAARDLFNKDYEYCAEFNITEDLLSHDSLMLVCEGLDTLTEIHINGKFLAGTDNMFRTWRFDIKKYVVPGENKISITFFSPLKYIEKAMAGVKGTRDEVNFCADGCIPGTNFIRKAHCMFGWDWGPQLPDAGIWKDIYLEAYDKARISDVLINQHHKENEVDLEINLSVDTLRQRKSSRAVFELTSPDGSVLSSEVTDVTGEPKSVINIKKP